MGCAGKPAAPFDTLKTANLTAYRLQNNDPTPPPIAAAPGAAPGALPTIPGIDPNALAAGVAALQKLIPPGLQIPGLSDSEGELLAAALAQIVGIEEVLTSRLAERNAA